MLFSLRLSSEIHQIDPVSRIKCLLSWKILWLYFWKHLDEIPILGSEHAMVRCGHEWWKKHHLFVLWFCTWMTLMKLRKSWYLYLEKGKREMARFNWDYYVMQKICFILQLFISSSVFKYELSFSVCAGFVWRGGEGLFGFGVIFWLAGWFGSLCFLCAASVFW